MSVINPNEKIVWTTTSVHGNSITLYQDALDHLLLHPEMMGQEGEIKKAVENPSKVVEGWDAKSCGFEYPSATNPNGIRVYVKHQRETFLDGNVDGEVTTAYPVQPKKYPKAHKGSEIPLKKGGGQK